MAKTRMNVLILACCAMISSAAFAQGVPSLEESLKNANPEQVAKMQDWLQDSSLSNAGSDIDPQTVVLSGLDGGQFTASEVADLKDALAIVSANSEYFSYDMAAVIQSAVDAGGITATEAAETMRLFALLSPEAKAIIGGDPNFSTREESLARFNPEDRAIICSAPVSYYC